MNTQFKLLRSDVCLITLTLNGRMFGRWEKFDCRQFYQPYILHSIEALQTDVKLNIFVADFLLYFYEVCWLE